MGDIWLNEYTINTNMWEYTKKSKKSLELNRKYERMIMRWWVFCLSYILNTSTYSNNYRHSWQHWLGKVTNLKVFKRREITFADKLPSRCNRWNSSYHKIFTKKAFWLESQNALLKLATLPKNTWHMQNSARSDSHNSLDREVKGRRWLFLHIFGYRPVFG